MFCTDCKKRDTCKEVCSKLELHLKSQGIYSANYIRKSSDTPMSPEKIDHISAKRVFKRKYGQTPKVQESDQNDEQMG